MKIGIIGAGNVGVTLGKRLQENGHSVRWGVPDPTKPKYEGLDVTPVAEAVEGADIVLLATPWFATEEAILRAGNLSGKIVIDTTNPIERDFSGLLDLGGLSAAEHIARWAAGARVVKAFNTLGYNIMADPQFGTERATLLIAGDDTDSKSTVMDLSRQLGFSPLDAGSLNMARHLESLAWIWICLAVKQGHGREIVLNVVPR